jgi:hypothetical protein
MGQLIRYVRVGRILPFRTLDNRVWPGRVVAVHADGTFDVRVGSNGPIFRHFTSSPRHAMAVQTTGMAIMMRDAVAAWRAKDF